MQTYTEAQRARAIRLRFEDDLPLSVVAERLSIPKGTLEVWFREHRRACVS